MVSAKHISMLTFQVMQSSFFDGMFDFFDSLGESLAGKLPMIYPVQILTYKSIPQAQVQKANQLKLPWKMVVKKVKN